MPISIGVWIKIGYFVLCLFVWSGSYNFFVDAGLGTQISAILSALIFLASLAVFFPRVKAVLEAIIEAIRDIIKFLGL